MGLRMGEHPAGAKAPAAPWEARVQRGLQAKACRVSRRRGGERLRTAGRREEAARAQAVSTNWSGGGRSVAIRETYAAAIKASNWLAQSSTLLAKHEVAAWRAGDQNWTVWKFGGTCVAGPERLKKVAELMKEEMEKGTKLCVVLSAQGKTSENPVKVTDQLLNAVAKASKKDRSFVEDLGRIEARHVQAAREMLPENDRLLEEYVQILQEDIKNLTAMLKAITIVGVSSENFSDFVIGHGELWNARLMTAYLKTVGMSGASMMDARDVLVVEPSEQDTVEVDYETSLKNLDVWHEKQQSQSSSESGPCPLVVTGFIARQPDGVATTLRRNGSDYSGTILGALLQASSITIWTDVDGVYSADPRAVSDAEPLQHLTYNEAWEMSYFGANVLHPRSTLPAMRFNIPIKIKNIFNLGAEGTTVDGFSTVEVNASLGRGSRWKNVVKGFAAIENCSVVNIEGTGMVGVPGTASRIFSCIRDAGINVIMISQGSSEHSVCFAVKSVDAESALAALRYEFREFIESGLLSNVDSVDGCTILAAVGSHLVDSVGASARMFSALAQAGVSILATAQGCSEHNITVVIDDDDAEAALGAVHSAFYLSDTTVAVGLVGPGLVGKVLLEQFNTHLDTLREERHIDIRTFGIATSKKMLLSNSPIDLDRWEEDFEAHSVPCDLNLFKEHIASRTMPNSVIIDCTASDAVPQYYESWMKDGVHVITPNKKLNSGPLERYQAVKALQEKWFVHYFYEATVGAGLPVIATIQHLVSTGDRMKRIEGVFSGTLSYIFNTFAKGESSFSDIVKEAKANGFTEPDPRDDLSGMDVARKVTTLARESGLELELEDIPVQSLVPEELQKCKTAEEFLTELPKYDGEMAQKQKDAADKGMVLRYVGVVDVANAKGSVELQEYPSSHPFAQLDGTDNIVLCVTDRYDPQPLVITGPGAGAEVTAGGVFSDLIRLCAHFGAPS